MLATLLIPAVGGGGDNHLRCLIWVQAEVIIGGPTGDMVKFVLDGDAIVSRHLQVHVICIFQQLVQLVDRVEIRCGDDETGPDRLPNPE